MNQNRLKKKVVITIIVLFAIPFFIWQLNTNESFITEVGELKISSNPNDIYITNLPDIDYSEVNDAYYDHDIEMLIITPPSQPSFRTAVEPLRDWKNEKGVKTIILSNYTAYPGVDDPEKIRNMIKDFYEKENIQWVLLAGDAQSNLIPIRHVYNPDVIDTGPGFSEHSNWNDYIKPTDFYYADLTGNWDSDGDLKYGESARYNAQGVDEIDWIPEVYVGRLPANNAIELGNMVNKTIKYESDPEIGDWMNEMLLAGVISNTVGQEPPDGEDESRLTEYIWENYVEPEMNFTHLYKTTYFTVNTTVHSSDNVEVIDSTTDFSSEFNSGYSTVMFAGHGAPSVFSSEGSGVTSIYTNTLAFSSSNTNMPSLVYADTCLTASYDMNDNSIGEFLIKRQNSGAIGYIGALRVTWYVLDDPDFEVVNRANANLFWKEFFENKNYRQGKTLYDSKVEYMNSPIFEARRTSMYIEYNRKNILTYCLLGDPEVDIYTNTPNSVSNPFTEDIHEGQLVSITIKDNLSQIVPYARVHLTTEDGKYRTVYADENGLTNFRVYPTANEKYNVTITGHNLVPSYFNFTTISDINKPEIINVDCSHQIATSLTSLCFNVDTCDNASGIKDVIELIINQQSGDQISYTFSNQIEENRTIFDINLNKLEPGDYLMIIASRDYANNTLIYSISFQFSIPIPLGYYMLIVGLVMITGFAGISVYLVYSGIQKYSIIYKRMEDI